MIKLCIFLLLLLTGATPIKQVVQSSAPSAKEKSLHLSKDKGNTLKDTCYTGLYLKNIYDLHPEEYSYTADFWIWFDHKQSGLDPLNNVEIINAKQVTYTDFYHAHADKKVLLASESDRITLIHDWRLENYPFDRQLLHIELEAGLDTTKMILRPIVDSFKIYKGLILPGWKIHSFSAKDSLVTYDSDFGESQLKGKSTYSRITYEIEIYRQSWGLFFKLLIGLYISFLVSFLVFFIPPNRDARFGLSIGGLFAAIANKYVVDSNIPVSISFSFVDQAHVVTFLLILVTLICSVISLKISKGNKSHQRELFDRTCAWIIGSSYFIINAVLIILVNNR